MASGMMAEAVSDAVGADATVIAEAITEAINATEWFPPTYEFTELATEKTYIQSLQGGALIGLAAALYLFFTGQRAGLSGIYSSKLGITRSSTGRVL